MELAVGEALEAVAYAHREACAAAGFAHAVHENRFATTDAGVVQGDVGVCTLTKSVVCSHDEEVCLAV